MRWNLEARITPTDVKQKKKKCHFQKLNVILRNFIFTKKMKLFSRKTLHRHRWDIVSLLIIGRSNLVSWRDIHPSIGYCSS